MARIVQLIKCSTYSNTKFETKISHCAYILQQIFQYEFVSALFLLINTQVLPSDEVMLALTLVVEEMSWSSDCHERTQRGIGLVRREESV